MAAKTLAYWLDYFCERTMRVVEGADSFTTMVFALTDDTIFNNSLLDVDCEGDEKLARFRTFGIQLAAEKKSPDLIVVAELLVTRDNNPIMVLHGSARSGERGICGFRIEIDQKKKIRVRDPIGFTGSATEYSPASEVFEGLRRGM